MIGPFARLHELRGSHALEEWQCNRNLAGDKVHVDAPVERVFDHIKDPANFVAADPAPVELSQLSITPEGVGSTWPTSWRAFGRKFQGSWTRTEYVLNERIVDEVSTGATWAFTTTPDPAGTTLGLAFAFTTKWTLMNTVIRWALVTQDVHFSPSKVFSIQPSSTRGGDLHVAEADARVTTLKSEEPNSSG